MATSSAPSLRRSCLKVDLGESQHAALLALVEMRAARRQHASGSDDGFMSRASALFGKSSASLPQLVDKGTNLSKLKRMGVCPADFVQHHDIQFKRLSAQYDVSALVDFGCTWQHCLALGFDVDDLSRLTPQNYHDLQLTAKQLTQDLPLTAEDFLKMKLQPHVLRELKFDFSHFLDLKLAPQQLAQCMTQHDLETYFQPTPAQLQQLQQGATRPQRSVPHASRPARNLPANRSAAGLSF